MTTFLLSALLALASATGGTLPGTALAAPAGDLEHPPAAHVGADSGSVPTSDLRAADSLVASWVDAGRIPGAVLLVAQGGRTRLEKAYGWAQRFDYGDGQYGKWPGGPADPMGAAHGPTPGDSAAHPGVRALARPVPMTTATVFDMASVTKVMATTFAVMMLVDEGKLDLDAPVSTYLPDFRGGGKDAITPRLLLTHRSGLSQWKPIFYHASDEREAYRYIRDLPLAWAPGAGRHYSDLGFMLLGVIVERISGQPLDAFVHGRLYAPLGLAHTGYRRTGSAPKARAGAFAATSHGNPYEYRMVHDTTFGYRIGGDADAWDGWRHHTLIGEVNDGNAYHAFNGVAGHAGLFSTAEELEVLLQLLLDGGEYGGRRYVGREVVDAFMVPTGDGQALGWQVPAYAPAGSFDHTGFTGTYVLGVRERRLVVVLLINRQNVGVNGRTLYPNVGPLQRAVAEALLRQPPSSSR